MPFTQEMSRIKMSLPSVPQTLSICCFWSYRLCSLQLCQFFYQINLHLYLMSQQLFIFQKGYSLFFLLLHTSVFFEWQLQFALHMKEHPRFFSFLQSNRTIFLTTRLDVMLCLRKRFWVIKVYKENLLSYQSKAEILKKEQTKCFSKTCFNQNPNFLKLKSHT